MPARNAMKFRTTLAGRFIPRVRRVNYWLIAQGLILLMRILRLLPVDRALDLAGRAAVRLGPLFGRHRTALSNLRMAYPEMSEAEIAEVARDMWNNMGRLGAEYVFLDRLFHYDPHRPGGGRIEVEGTERFIRLANDPKPHIIFTAHLGNFESLPIIAAAHGLRVTSLFRPPNNPYLARFIFSSRNAMMDDLVASDSGAAFQLAAILEKNGNIGVLVDQKFVNGLTTTFFGRPVETNPVVPILARRFDCEVYPVRSIRLPKNRYRMVFEEELKLTRNALGEIDIFAATQQLNDVVERWVREDPGQWTWFHKRWNKTGFRRALRKPKAPRPA